MRTNRCFRIAAFCCAMILLLSFISGCRASDSLGSAPTDSKPQPTTPADPLIHELDTAMYFTTFDMYNETSSKYESPFKLRIEEYADGEYSINFDMDFPEDWPYEVGKQAAKLWDRDADLPFYSTKIYLHDILYGSDGYIAHDYLVDFEKEYVMFYVCSNIVAVYTVGASDPDVDPDTIVAHFKELYDLHGHDELLDLVDSE